MMMTQYSKVPDLDWILDAKCMDVERVKDVELEMNMELQLMDTEKNKTMMTSMEYCGPCSPPPPRSLPQ